MTYEYDKLYLRPWGSSGAYNEFPYSIDGVHNSMPEHEGTLNDVDLDAYTNLDGYTIRNRVRHNVITLDFSVPEMSGEELHNLLSYTDGVWFDAYFWNETDWAFASKKMYRSGTISYHRYKIDKSNPNNNIYTDVRFTFIQE